MKDLNAHRAINYVACYGFERSIGVNRNKHTNVKLIKCVQSSHAHSNIDFYPSGCDRSESESI